MTGPRVPLCFGLYCRDWEPIMSVAFDTLKFVEEESPGWRIFLAPQAKAAAEAFADATGEQLTTKSDLREIGTDLRAEIARQWADMREEIAPVKADVLLSQMDDGLRIGVPDRDFRKAFHALSRSIWSQQAMSDTATREEVATLRTSDRGDENRDLQMVGGRGVVLSGDHDVRLARRARPRRSLNRRRLTHPASDGVLNSQQAGARRPVRPP